jgi:hypothetical protein
MAFSRFHKDNDTIPCHICGMTANNPATGPKIDMSVSGNSPAIDIRIKVAVHSRCLKKKLEAIR